MLSVLCILSSVVLQMNPRNGGVEALRFPDDPDGMNWVEGNRTWGLPRYYDTFKRVYALYGLERASDGIVTYTNRETRVTVERRRTEDGSLADRYEVENFSAHDVYFRRGDFGVYATFNDSYADAATCEKQRCHAHLWCGGEAGYVHAVPMGPKAAELGLVLTDGSLDTYSIERFWHEYSNDRGDFILHPEPFHLLPGKRKTVFAWTLFRTAKGSFEKDLVSRGGKYVTLEHETVFPDEKFRIRLNGESVGEVAPKGFGEQNLDFTAADGKRVRVRGYVSLPLEELMAKRVKRICREHQVLEKESPLYGAFVIYDNEEKTRYFDHANRDWNACRERVSMAAFLVKWLQTHEDAEARQALDLWEKFLLREFYEEETGGVFDGIGRDPLHKRLYNAPWIITMWREFYALKKDPIYLDRLEKTIAGYYAQGGDRFYPNGCTFSDAIETLEKAGRRVPRLRAAVDGHVRNLMKNGIEYPAHEVRFEQTIATPAVAIPADYCLRLGGGEDVKAHTARQMDVLDRFAGDQPHYRLGGIPIKHWDAFWFGKRQVMGDTFPHYQCVLSARAYDLYARLTGETVYRRKAERILRNVLCNWDAEAAGSCAYVFPFRVTLLDKEGRPFRTDRGEFADEWANDQDFALYFLLELRAR